MPKREPQDLAIKGLSLAFFGVPACFYQNQERQLGTRKAVALIAYLAIRKTAVARAELDVLLWPEHDSARARRSLRDELSRINKVLGKELIISSGQYLKLNSVGLELDLWLFEKALDQSDFAKAVSLYQGTLLEGLFVKEAAPFETWLEEQRAMFEQMYLFTLEQLAMQAELIEDYTSARAFYLKSIATDHLREKSYFEAIRLSLLLSDRPTALKLFEDLKRACLELGLEHDPKVDKLLADGSSKSAGKNASWHNLPGTITSFLGREKLLEQAKHLLSRADLRLLTLMGPGGVGKTRLSLQIAKELVHDFKDGVLWLELAPLKTPAELLAKLMALLEIPDTSLEPLTSVIAKLKNKYSLIVFDNFEQLGEAAPLVADLLKACSGLKIMVTSRVSLKLQGEFRFMVAPLDLPNKHLAPPDLAKNPAIELFRQRALTIDPHFHLDHETLYDIADLCIHLDGLPLAIELAAARIKLFSPKLLLGRLEQRFSLLSSSARDLAERHKALRSTLDWSYDSLSLLEQTFLNRLGLFLAGFGFAAVEALCSDLTPNSMDTLEALIDKSMVQRAVVAHEPRFSLLESIREMCLEKLTADKALRALKKRHAMYFLVLVETSEDKLMSSEQAAILAKLELEQRNIREALLFFQEYEPEKMLQLANGLWHYWLLKGQFSEGRQWLETALLHSGDNLEARAKALNSYGALALQQADLQRAKPYLEKSLELWQASNNKTGMASNFNNLGILARRQGEFELAEHYYLECLSLRRELGNRYGEAAILRNLGSLAIYQENWENAKDFLEQALIISQKLGEQSGIGSTLSNLGLVSLYQGDTETAITLYQESLEFNRMSDDKLSIAISLGNLGTAFLKAEKRAEAERCFKEYLELSETIGDQEGIASSLEGLACILATTKPERAARLYGKASAMRSKLGLSLSTKDKDQLDQYLVPAMQHLGDYFSVLASSAKYLDTYKITN